MKDIAQIIVTVIISVIASSGFWAFLTTQLSKKDVKTELLMGLAHDRIVTLGMKYIEIGSITKDEYESLHNYLYSPYIKMGGDSDGSVKRIMESVTKLPIRTAAYPVIEIG